MGSIIGKKIDYNGLGVLRGQRHIPRIHWPKYPPPPGSATQPFLVFLGEVCCVTTLKWGCEARRANENRMDPLLKNCLLSGYQKQKHRQQPDNNSIKHRKWLRGQNRLHPINLGLSVAKVRFAQSKFSYAQTQWRERKKEKHFVFKQHVFKRIPRSRVYESCLACQHLI